MPNGERYLRVGGTRGRHFAGTNFQPRKRLENAATPTRRVHAVLGNLYERKTHRLKHDTTAKLTELLHATETLTITKKTHLPKHWLSIFINPVNVKPDTSI